MFKIINGIFYSEHELKLDHHAIAKQVIEAKEADNDDPRFRGDGDDYNGYFDYEGYDPQHTFHEDSNIFKETFKAVDKQVSKVLESIFDTDRYFKVEEMWGHVIAPGEQTMVHNHGGRLVEADLGLSWVYYASVPTNSGNLFFLNNTAGNIYHHETYPQVGKLFIFNSNLLHYTPKNASKYPRVSIAGNHEATKAFKQYITADDNFKSPFWMYSGRES